MVEAYKKFDSIRIKAGRINGWKQVHYERPQK